MTQTRSEDEVERNPFAQSRRSLIWFAVSAIAPVLLTAWAILQGDWAQAVFWTVSEIFVWGVFGWFRLMEYLHDMRKGSTDQVV